MRKYKPSNKAYFDGITGFIPCKVIDTDNNHRVDIEFTKDREGYKRGDKLNDINAAWVVPQCELYTRDGMYRIHTFYSWVKTQEGYIYNIRTRGVI